MPGLILTRDKNRNALKVKKIDLGKDKTIESDGNNIIVQNLKTTELTDINCTSITSSGYVSSNSISTGNVNASTITTTGNCNLGGVLSLQGNFNFNGACTGFNCPSYNNITGQTNMSFNDVNGNPQCQVDTANGYYGIRYYRSGMVGWGNFIGFRYNNSNHLYVYSSGNQVLDLVSNGSDDRLKYDEEYLPNNCVEILKKVKPETYMKLGYLNSTEPGVKESGVIAQQIWYQVPELRHLVFTEATPDENIEIPTDPNVDPDYSSWGDEPASVNYNGLVAFCIKAIQELSDEIELLKSRLGQP